MGAFPGRVRTGGAAPSWRPRVRGQAVGIAGEVLHSRRRLPRAPLPGEAPLPAEACSGEGGQGARGAPLSPGLGAVLAARVSGPLAQEPSARQDGSRELVAVAGECSVARSGGSKMLRWGRS